MNESNQPSVPFHPSGSDISLPPSPPPAQGQGTVAGSSPLPEKFSQPKVREELRNELRAEEWALHKELLAIGREILKNFYENRQKSTVADLARIIDLADKLGRLATESSDGSVQQHDTTVLVLQFETALKTVYAHRDAQGKPRPPGAVVDV